MIIAGCILYVIIGLIVSSIVSKVLKFKSTDKFEDCFFSGMIFFFYPIIFLSLIVAIPLLAIGKLVVYIRDTGYLSQIRKSDERI